MFHHDKWIIDAVIDNDAKQVLVLDTSNALTIWDINSGEKLPHFIHIENEDFRIHNWNWDGKSVVINNGRLVWDTENIEIKEFDITLEELKTPENYNHIANDRISSHSKSVNSDCSRIRSTWR